MVKTNKVVSSFQSLGFSKLRRISSHSGGGYFATCQGSERHLHHPTSGVHAERRPITQYDRQWANKYSDQNPIGEDTTKTGNGS